MMSYYSDESLTIRIDDDDLLKSYKLGQIVTLTVKGKVMELESSREEDDYSEQPVAVGQSKSKKVKKRLVPGRIVMKVSEINGEDTDVTGRGLSMVDDEEEYE